MFIDAVNLYLGFLLREKLHLEVDSLFVSDGTIILNFSLIFVLILLIIFEASQEIYGLVVIDSMNFTTMNLEFLRVLENNESLLKTICVFT